MARKNKYAMFGMGMRGLKELDKAFQELPKIYTKRLLHAALRRVGMKFRNASRMVAPKRFGGLKKSIKIGKSSAATARRFGKGSVSLRVGTVKGKGGAAWRAHFGEYGTSNETARPWFRPAWNASLGGYNSELSAELWHVLKRTARRLRKQAVSGKLSKAGKRALLR